MSRRAKKAVGSSNPDRWKVEINYLNGKIGTHFIEEIEDLDEIVETGPNWNTIYDIVITLNRHIKPDDSQAWMAKANQLFNDLIDELTDDPDLSLETTAESVFTACYDQGMTPEEALGVFKVEIGLVRPEGVKNEH